MVAGPLCLLGCSLRLLLTLACSEHKAEVLQGSNLSSIPSVWAMWVSNGGRFWLMPHRRQLSVMVRSLEKCDLKTPYNSQ